MTTTPKPTFSIEYLLDILENFYPFFEKKMKTELIPVTHYFYQVTRISWLSENKDGSGLFLLHPITKNPRKVKVDLSVTKSINLTYYLQDAKVKKYKLEELSITLPFRIELEEDHYTIGALFNRKYDYGTLPTEEDAIHITELLKAKAMEQIKNAAIVKEPIKNNKPMRERF